MDAAINAWPSKSKPTMVFEKQAKGKAPNSLAWGASKKSTRNGCCAQAT